MKNIKDKNKNVTSNKLEEKGAKKRKENRPRKKLALLGLNKPNSTRKPQLLNLKLSANNDINIDINKVYNNKLIKSSDIDININKKEANKKKKIKSFALIKFQKLLKKKKKRIKI